MMIQARTVRWVAAAAMAVAAAPSWSIDLAEAYRLAQQRDASIRGTRAAADAGRERLPQARAQLLPSVTVTSSRYRNDLDTTAPNILGQRTISHDLYNSSNDAITLRQPLYRKQLWAQYRQAEAQVADVNAQLERDEQQVVMRVTQAYFEALLAEEQLVLIGLQKIAYATQVDAARKALNAGSGTRTDIDEAQARLDLAIAQELEARQNVDLSRRQLGVIIGEPLVGSISALDIDKLRLAAPTPATVEEWTQLAEAASPEMASARAQVDATRADLDRARAGHLPTVDLVVQASRSLSDNITRLDTRYIQKQVGVQMTIPIFQGGYVNSQVREALAQVERAEAHLDEVRLDLGVRVHKEFRGVTEGVLKVRALEQAVRSAEQLVTSSRRSFEAGARTRVDILNAEQQAGQARRDLAQARMTYLTSRVRLKALAGDLRADNVAEINGWLKAR